MLHSIDREGKLLDVSDRWLKVLGYTREEVVGRKASDFLTEESREYAETAAISEFIQTGSAENLEYQFVKKSGQVIDVLLSAVAEYDDAGDFERSLAVLTDLTDNRRDEEKLRFRNALLSAERDSSIDGLLVVDRDRNWVDYNRRFIDMWKIPSDVVASKSSQLALESVRHRLVDPDAFVSRILHMYDHPLEKSTDEIELLDGRVFERYSAPLISEEGEYYGRLWSYRDITERRSLENQLRQAQKMEAVGQLTAGVAHNFNNMLQGIMSNVENAAEVEDGATYLEASLTAARRAATMVRQLMLYARQADPSDRAQCDLVPVIERAADFCRSTFDRHLQISVDIQPDLGKVWGDSALIEQVLLNLLLNARDAIIPAPVSRTQNRIGVRAYSLYADQGPHAGSYIRIEVSDRGVGMDPDTQRRIFDPFFTTKDVGQGSGLGLSTAFGIVRQHGGWIDCDSSPGVGSTFTVHLPVLATETQEEEEQPSADATPLPGGSETILIVEDEDEVRVPVVEVLNRCGYDVLEARDGREALFTMNTQPRIDLVLLDLSLPEISGHEVLKRLRSRRDDMRVVIFTGQTSDAQGPLEAETILRKPVPFNDLARTVRDVLDT